MKRERLRPLNQRGQAAIFVALMFNVLFVFFAMAINVALVVHDKINLQNSVDMAAYYAAAKQAELLNVIAHENYMIRQSWKLLVWRYRDLGTMGLFQAPSPLHPVRSGEVTDDVYPPAVQPAVCVAYQPTWIETPIGENLCNREALSVPALPSVSVIAGFLGLNAGIAALSNQLQMQFSHECSKFGAWNWWYGMTIMHAFRLDQRNRKQVITALAKDLAGTGSDGDFIDLDGNSALQGAKTTFLKNLTYSNRTSFEAGGGDFQMFNSMNGIDMSKWLVEIQTIPMMLYTDAENTGDYGSCNTYKQAVSTLPARQESRDLLTQPFPTGYQAADLMQWAPDEAGFLAGSDYQYSIGYEKNPWYMTYVGIKANATPRQIFFPFGSGVSMGARSFAKPFGGRIGPWFSSLWQSGDPTSSGTPTDALMAPRMVQGGNAPDPNDPHRLPNYSRFPGDTLGMMSKLTLNSLNGLGNLLISINTYKNIKADMSIGGANDVLAWDGINNKAPDVRNYEISILSPDLFDITYYSIEPNFAANYFVRLSANRQALGIPADLPLRPDLGFSPLLPNFTVQDQIAVQATTPLQKPEAYFFVRTKANLLTSWLPGPGAFNYDVQGAMANFGKCALPDDGLKYFTPGSCVAGGGRTGYSVKIINRDALLSSEHKIGGVGVAAGPILNPPTW